MSYQKPSPIEKAIQPIQRFIQQEKSGGIVLGISVLLALFLANSPWAESYVHFFEHRIGLRFNDTPVLEYSLHHWINDGLMSVFFFVVGLELKREIVAGELSNPRNALLPIVAALGGMIVPALIYIALNPGAAVSSGWGIPMATDIAFALGVLYLLGDRIPLSLKIFLTALAIVDDLGAVLVIAFFYTSDISLMHLLIGLLFLLIMFIGNKMGVRSVLFYAILGILGVWTAFLLSGVHATIAAVLAAFAIPARIKVKEQVYTGRVKQYLYQFTAADSSNEKAVLTGEQLHTLDHIRKETDDATPPMQKLEHALHPLVTFIVIPIFALANAGIALDMDVSTLFNTNVSLGVGLGLLIGKVVGVVGFTLLCIKLRIAPYPEGMHFRNLLGLGFLAAIGFTMSLFVTSLAFTDELYMTQAKVGIFVASIIGGVTGYFLLRKTSKKQD